MKSQENFQDILNLKESVYINIYEFFQSNNCFSAVGMGVFHSGVEVYRQEYAFGGHDFSISGIFRSGPQQPPLKVMHKKKIFVGITRLSEEQVKHLVENMGTYYLGNRYHILERNCNHFSKDLVRNLTGRKQAFPNWVNRSAKLAHYMRCIIPNSLLPPPTEHDITKPDFRVFTSEGGASARHYEILKQQQYQTLIHIIEQGYVNQDDIEQFVIPKPLINGNIPPEDFIEAITREVITRKAQRDVQKSQTAQEYEEYDDVPNPQDHPSLNGGQLFKTQLPKVLKNQLSTKAIVNQYSNYDMSELQDSQYLESYPYEPGSTLNALHQHNHPLEKTKSKLNIETGFLFPSDRFLHRQEEGPGGKLESVYQQQLRNARDESARSSPERKEHSGKDGRRSSQYRRINTDYTTAPSIASNANTEKTAHDYVSSVSRSTRTHNENSHSSKYHTHKQSRNRSYKDPNDSHHTKQTDQRFASARQSSVASSRDGHSHSIQRDQKGSERQRGSYGSRGRNQEARRESVDQQSMSEQSSRAELLKNRQGMSSQMEPSVRSSVRRSSRSRNNKSASFKNTFYNDSDSDRDTQMDGGEGDLIYVESQSLESDQIVQGVKGRSGQLHQHVQQHGHQNGHQNDKRSNYNAKLHQQARQYMERQKNSMGGQIKDPPIQVESEQEESLIDGLDNTSPQNFRVDLNSQNYHQQQIQRPKFVGDQLPLGGTYVALQHQHPETHVSNYQSDNDYNNNQQTSDSEHSFDLTSTLVNLQNLESYLNENEDQELETKQLLQDTSPEDADDQDFEQLFQKQQRLLYLQQQQLLKLQQQQDDYKQMWQQFQCSFDMESYRTNSRNCVAQI